MSDISTAQFWKLQKDTIQGQAGKPFYHTPGNDIVFPQSIADLSESASIGSDAIMKNKCLCNFKHMQYFRCVAKLCSDSQDMIFLGRDEQEDNRLTYVKKKGYRWKFWNFDLKNVIEDEQPQPSAIYQKLGCCSKRTDVGVWLPIQSPQQGTIDCNTTRMGGTQKHITQPSPFYIKQNATMGQWMQMIVSNYKCCNGDLGCGLAAISSTSNQKVSPTASTKKKQLVVNDTKSFKQEVTDENPIGFWQLYACYQNPDVPGQWGLPPSKESDSWQIDKWQAIKDPNVAQDILLDTRGEHLCLSQYAFNNPNDTNGINAPCTGLPAKEAKRWNIVKYGPVSGIDTFYYKGVPRHPVQLVTNPPTKDVDKIDIPEIVYGIPFINCTWQHTQPINQKGKCQVIGSHNRCTAYMWIFNKASAQAIEAYKNGDKTALSLQAAIVPETGYGITNKHTCYLGSTSIQKVGDTSPEGLAYYNFQFMDDNPYPCNVPVLPQYRYTSLQEPSNSSSSSGSTSTAYKWACIEVPLQVIYCKGGQTFQTLEYIGTGAHNEKDQWANKVACQYGYSLKLVASTAIYSTLYPSSNKWKASTALTLGQTQGQYLPSLDARVYTQQQYNKSILKKVIQSNQGIVGNSYYRHPDMPLPSYSFNDANGVPSNGFQYLYYIAPVKEKKVEEGQLQQTTLYIDLQNVDSPLTRMPVVIHRSADRLNKVNIGGYKTFCYYKKAEEPEKGELFFYSGIPDNFSPWDTSDLFVIPDGSPSTTNLDKKYSPWSSDAKNTPFNVINESQLDSPEVFPSLPPFWKRLQSRGIVNDNTATQFQTSVLDARFLEYDCEASKKCYVIKAATELDATKYVHLAVCMQFHQGTDNEYDYVNLSQTKISEADKIIPHRVYRWVQRAFNITGQRLVVDKNEEADWSKRYVIQSATINYNIPSQHQVYQTTFFKQKDATEYKVTNAAITTGFYVIQQIEEQQVYRRLHCVFRTGKRKGEQLLPEDFYNLTQQVQIETLLSTDINVAKEAVTDPAKVLAACNVVFVVVNPHYISTGNYVTSYQVANKMAFDYKAKSICRQQYQAIQKGGKSTYELQDVDFDPTYAPWNNTGDVKEYIDFQKFFFKSNTADFTNVEKEQIEKCFQDQYLIFCAHITKEDIQTDQAADDLLCRIGPPGKPIVVGDTQHPQCDWDKSDSVSIWEYIQKHIRFTQVFDIFKTKADLLNIEILDSKALPKAGYYLNTDFTQNIQQIAQPSTIISMSHSDSTLAIPTNTYPAIRYSRQIQLNGCQCYLCLPIATPVLQLQKTALYKTSDSDSAGVQASMLDILNSFLAADVFKHILDEYSFTYNADNNPISQAAAIYIFYRYFIHGKDQAAVDDEIKAGSFSPPIQVYFGNTCCDCADFVSFIDTMAQDLQCSCSFQYSTNSATAAMYLNSDSIIDNVDKLHTLKYLYSPDAQSYPITTSIEYTTDPIIIQQSNSCSKNTMIDFHATSAITYYKIPDINLSTKQNDIDIEIQDAQLQVTQTLNQLKDSSIKLNILDFSIKLSIYKYSHILNFLKSTMYNSYQLIEEKKVETVVVTFQQGMLFGKAIGYQGFSPVFTSKDGGKTFVGNNGEGGYAVPEIISRFKGVLTLRKRSDNYWQLGHRFVGDSGTTIEPELLRSSTAASNIEDVSWPQPVSTSAKQQDGIGTIKTSFPAGQSSVGSGWNVSNKSQTEEVSKTTLYAIESSYSYLLGTYTIWKSDQASINITRTSNTNYGFRATFSYNNISTYVSINDKSSLSSFIKKLNQNLSNRTPLLKLKPKDNTTEVSAKQVELTKDGSTYSGSIANTDYSYSLQYSPSRVIVTQNVSNSQLFKITITGNFASIQEISYPYNFKVVKNITSTSIQYLYLQSPFLSDYKSRIWDGIKASLSYYNNSWRLYNKEQKSYIYPVSTDDSPLECNWGEQYNLSDAQNKTCILKQEETLRWYGTGDEYLNNAAFLIQRAIQTNTEQIWYLHQYNKSGRLIKSLVADKNSQYPWIQDTWSNYRDIFSVSLDKAGTIQDINISHTLYLMHINKSLSEKEWGIKEDTKSLVYNTTYSCWVLILDNIQYRASTSNATISPWDTELIWINTQDNAAAKIKIAVVKKAFILKSISYNSWSCNESPYALSIYRSEDKWALSFICSKANTDTYTIYSQVSVISPWDKSIWDFLGNISIAKNSNTKSYSTLLKPSDSSQPISKTNKWQNNSTQLYPQGQNWILIYNDVAYTGTKTDNSTVNCPTTYTWPQQITFSFAEGVDCSTINCAYSKPDKDNKQNVAVKIEKSEGTKYKAVGTVYTSDSISSVTTPSISRYVNGKIQLTKTETGETNEPQILNMTVSIATKQLACKKPASSTQKSTEGTEQQKECWSVTAKMTVSKDNGDSEATPYFTAEKTLSGISPKQGAITIVFSREGQIVKTEESIQQGDFTFTKESPLYTALITTDGQKAPEEMSPQYFYYTYIMQNEETGTYIKTFAPETTLFESINLRIKHKV